MTATGAADTAGLYRAGAWSGIALAVVYVVITGLYVTTGPLPSGGEAALAHLAGKEAVWWAIIGLSVFTDLLYLPVALAVYVALAPVNRNAMLLGAGLVVLFVVLDLAITWPNYAALISLSGQYGATTDAGARAVLVGAASYASTIVDSSLLAAYIILVPGLGLLVIGLVMLQSAFGKTAAYLGVASGVAAIVTVLGALVYEPLGTMAILAAVLTLIWFLVVGLRLLRYA